MGLFDPETKHCIPNDMGIAQVTGKGDFLSEIARLIVTVRLRLQTTKTASETITLLKQGP